MSDNNSITLTLSADQLRDLIRGAVCAALQEAGTSQEQDEFLDTKEVARILGISTKQVCRMVTSGQLPGHRVGKLLRISKSAVDNYMKSCDLSQFN